MGSSSLTFSGKAVLTVEVQLLRCAVDLAGGPRAEVRYPLSPNSYSDADYRDNAFLFERASRRLSEQVKNGSPKRLLPTNQGTALVR